MTGRAAPFASNSVIDAVRAAIMASARRIASFEHTCDSDTRAERFVLKIDVVALALAGLLSLFALGIARKVGRR
jgi:hypothetical protein